MVWISLGCKSFWQLADENHQALQAKPENSIIDMGRMTG